jgi:hypothetical protein
MRTKFGLEIATTLAEVCSPERMALVVYDMQAGIVHGRRDHDRYSYVPYCYGRENRSAAMPTR